MLIQESRNRTGFLPGWLYDAAEMHHWDLRHYAQHFWHPLVATSALQPGETLAVMLLDHPILLTWPQRGEPRAFLNRCPHRGVAFQTVGTSGSPCRRLICPYHGWTYNLQGELQAAAREQDFLEPFHREDWSLSALLCRIDGPLIWVALGPDAIPLNEQLELIHRETAEIWRKPLQQLRRTRRSLACNWKIAHDNTLDDYHVAIAHPTTLHREQGPVRDYVHRFSRFDNLLVTPHPSGGCFHTFGLPPWTHLLTWPDGRLALLEFLPESPNSTTMQLRLLAPKQTVTDSEAERWLKELITFLEEDRQLVESSQRSYASGFHPGPAHKLEQRILHWQAVYRELLPGPQASNDERSQAAIDAFGS